MTVVKLNGPAHLPDADKETTAAARDENSQAAYGCNAPTGDLVCPSPPYGRCDILRRTLPAESCSFFSIAAISASMPASRALQFPRRMGMLP